MIKTVKEIWAVGFKSWFWFVVMLDRNVNHYSLRHGECLPQYRNKPLKLAAAKQRAADIKFRLTLV